MNTGIGAQLLLKFVGFRALDRPGIRGHFVQSVQIFCCARRPGVLSVTRPERKRRCEIELREETARHILRVLLCEVREIERRFVKPHGLRKSSWQDADRRVCEGVGPSGTERDIPKIAGRFLRAWPRPVNAPERSGAARRSAFFAERGFTGRDPRPYPLPASEWLPYCRREAYR